jgi:soluble lytic murein transglycosylase-like protein
VVKADPHSGRLVRRIVAPPSRIAAERSAIDEIVQAAAREHDVDPLLVHSIIRVESGYNPFAVSPKGAEGLMQLVPETARRFGVKDVFDAEQNIRGGVRYFRYLQKRFQDERLALAAYNAGEGAVERYRWIPPYPETRSYVSLVGKTYDEARRAAQQAARDQSAGAGAREHAPIEVSIDAEGRLYLRTR